MRNHKRYFNIFMDCCKYQSGGTEYITSRNNALMVKVRKLLSDGAYRREQGLFVCDGLKLLEEALRWGDVKIMIRTDTARMPELWSDMKKTRQTRDIREIVIPVDVMRSIAPSKTPQGVLCVCAMPEKNIGGIENIKNIDLSGKRRYLILDGIQDPGNVGTILRAADAFGADGIFLLPGCADIFHPRTIRAAMGAVFRLNAWHCDTAKLADLLKEYKIALYGASAQKDAVDIRAANPGNLNRFAIAIGSEGRGLSEEVLKLCAGIWRIPIREQCESLNAAMAAVIFLWEAFRER